MKITIIVAVAENDVIGSDNKLLWRLRDDMKNFKRLTVGHFVLMGRKTFESIGKPLKDRTNLVITRNPGFNVPGIIRFDSIAKALQYSLDEKQEEVFIIGGGEIYREILPMADKIYYTKVHASPIGDTRFPSLHWNEWKVLSNESFVKNDRNDFDFDILELKKING